MGDEPSFLFQLHGSGLFCIPPHAFAAFEVALKNAEIALHTALSSGAEVKSAGSAFSDGPKQWA